VVDAINPLTPDFSLAIGHTDSAGETVARLAPGARVVKAFNTTGANNMADSRYATGKLMMAIAGDDAQAKNVVMGLASDLGFEPIDCGPLAMSRHLEPMAMVWIKLAIAQKMGRNFGFALQRR
jgi:predicted dinucleotide-binding enzyme